MRKPTLREDPPGSEPGQGTPATRPETQAGAGQHAADAPETRHEAGPTAPQETRDERVGPERRRVLTTLPSALEDRYRVVEELGGGGQARVLLVENAAAMRFIVKIYGDEAFAAKAEVLKRLGQVGSQHVVELVEHGVSDGYPYEVQKYLPLGSLHDLIRREGPRLSPGRVKEILHELVEALAHIHGHGIEHKDLNPNNVLVQADQPLDLVLADFGIAAGAEGSVRASTFMGATFPYAPPEAFAQVTEEDEDEGRKRRVVLYTTKWDWWSLGMMVVEMLTGHHPFQGCDNMTIVSRLATQNLDDLVTEVTDPAWRTLCRGLLRRDPKKRWGRGEVEKWLKNPSDPTLAVAEEVAPARAGFRFLGRSYQTKEELAEAFATNWDEVADLWRRRNQDLRDWLKHELGLKAVAEDLERIDRTQGLDLDAQVFSVIYALDPTAPLCLRGEELSESNLTALSERAPGDPRAGGMLRRLYRSYILQLADALASSGGLAALDDRWRVRAAASGSRLATLDSRWREVAQAYETHRQELARNGVTVPDLDDERLTVLLAAATPAPTVVEALRTRAAQAVTLDAARCSWFRQLGDPQTASVAALMLIPVVTGAADAAGKAKRSLVWRGVFGEVIRSAIIWALGGLVLAWIVMAVIS
jgi:eukaryotic-like serine/threonine-protein kinase